MSKPSRPSSPSKSAALGTHLHKRRHALKAISGSAVVAGLTDKLPDLWQRPLVHAAVLPAHAQASPGQPVLVFRVGQGQGMQEMQPLVIPIRRNPDGITIPVSQPQTRSVASAHRALNALIPAAHAQTNNPPSGLTAMNDEPIIIPVGGHSNVPLSDGTGTGTCDYLIRVVPDGEGYRVLGGPDNSSEGVGCGDLTIYPGMTEEGIGFDNGFMLRQDNIPGFTHVPVTGAPPPTPQTNPAFTVGFAQVAYEADEGLSVEIELAFSNWNRAANDYTELKLRVVGVGGTAHPDDLDLATSQAQINAQARFTGDLSITDGRFVAEITVPHNATDVTFPLVLRSDRQVEGDEILLLDIQPSLDFDPDNHFNISRRRTTITLKDLTPPLTSIPGEIYLQFAETDYGNRAVGQEFNIRINKIGPGAVTFNLVAEGENPPNLNDLLSIDLNALPTGATLSDTGLAISIPADHPDEFVDISVLVREGGEQLTLTLTDATSATGVPVQVVDGNQITLTLAGPPTTQAVPLVVEFAAGEYEVKEGESENITISSVSRSSHPETVVKLVRVRNRSVADTQDYDIADTGSVNTHGDDRQAFLTIPAATQAGTAVTHNIPLSAIADALFDEDDEPMQWRIETSRTGAYEIGAQGTALITITQPPVVSIGQVIGGEVGSGAVLEEQDRSFTESRAKNEFGGAIGITLALSAPLVPVPEPVIGGGTTPSAESGKVYFTVTRGPDTVEADYAIDHDNIDGLELEDAANNRYAFTLTAGQQEVSFNLLSDLGANPGTRNVDRSIIVTLMADPTDSTAYQINTDRNELTITITDSVVLSIEDAGSAPNFAANILTLNEGAEASFAVRASAASSAVTGFNLRFTPSATSTINNPSDFTLHAGDTPIRVVVQAVQGVTTYLFTGLSIPAGQTDLELTLRARHDNLTEQDETFAIDIVSITNRVELPTVSSTTRSIRITNVDRQTISWAQVGGYTIREPAGDDHAEDQFTAQDISITRTGNNPKPVLFEINDGNASAATDHTQFAPDIDFSLNGDLTRVAANRYQLAADASSFSVRVYRDRVSEADEVITLTLIADTDEAYILGRNTRITVRLRNTAVPPAPVQTISWARGSHVFIEPDAGDHANATDGYHERSINITRTGENPAPVIFSVNNGNARAAANHLQYAADIDFSLTGVTRVSPNRYQLADDASSFSIRIYRDRASESLENITFTLVSDDAYSLGAVTRTTITLVDAAAETAYTWTYSLDNYSIAGRFTTYLSSGTVTEDNVIENEYTVSEGGTELYKVTLGNGNGQVEVFGNNAETITGLTGYSFRYQIGTSGFTRSGFDFLLDDQGSPQYGFTFDAPTHWAIYGNFTRQISPFGLGSPVVTREGGPVDPPVVAPTTPGPAVGSDTYTWTWTQGEITVNGEFTLTNPATPAGTAIHEEDLSAHSFTVTHAEDGILYSLDLKAGELTTYATDGTSTTVTSTRIQEDFEYVIGATAFSETNSEVANTRFPVNLFYNFSIGFNYSTAGDKNWLITDASGSTLQNVPGFANGPVITPPSGIPAPAPTTAAPTTLAPLPQVGWAETAITITEPAAGAWNSGDDPFIDVDITVEFENVLQADRPAVHYRVSDGAGVKTGSGRTSAEQDDDYQLHSGTARPGGGSEDHYEINMLNQHDNDGDTQTFRVFRDNLLEGAETVTLTLIEDPDNPAAYTINQAKREMVITITNTGGVTTAAPTTQAGVVTVSFTQAAYSVREGEGFVLDVTKTGNHEITFDIVRQTESTADNTDIDSVGVTLPGRIVSGSSDFLDRTLTIGATESSLPVTYPLSVAMDDLTEGNETLTFGLENLTVAAGVTAELGDNPETTITIIDVPPPAPPTTAAPGPVERKFDWSWSPARSAGGTYTVTGSFKTTATGEIGPADVTEHTYTVLNNDGTEAYRVDLSNNMLSIAGATATSRTFTHEFKFDTSETAFKQENDAATAETLPVVLRSTDNTYGFDFFASQGWRLATGTTANRISAPNFTDGPTIGAGVIVVPAAPTTPAMPPTTIGPPVLSFSTASEQEWDVGDPPANISLNLISDREITSDDAAVVVALQIQDESGNTSSDLYITFLPEVQDFTDVAPAYPPAGTRYTTLTTGRSAWSVEIGPDSVTPGDASNYVGQTVRIVLLDVGETTTAGGSGTTTSGYQRGTPHTINLRVFNSTTTAAPTTVAPTTTPAAGPERSFTWSQSIGTHNIEGEFRTFAVSGDITESDLTYSVLKVSNGSTELYTLDMVNEVAEQADGTAITTITQWTNNFRVSLGDTPAFRYIPNVGIVLFAQNSTAFWGVWANGTSAIWNVYGGETKTSLGNTATDPTITETTGSIAPAPTTTPVPTDPSFSYTWVGVDKGGTQNNTTDIEADGGLWVVNGEFRTAATGTITEADLSYHVLTVKKAGVLQYTIDLVRDKDGGMTAGTGSLTLAGGSPVNISGSDSTSISGSTFGQHYHNVDYEIGDASFTLSSGRFQFDARLFDTVRRNYGLRYDASWLLDNGGQFSSFAENSIPPVITAGLSPPQSKVSVAFNAATYEVTEGESVNIVVDISPFGDYPETYIALRRDGGTADAADYSVTVSDPITSYSNAERVVITLPGGSSSADYRFGVSATTDILVPETGETLVWTIESSPQYEVGSNSSTTVTIINAPTTPPAIESLYYTWTGIDGVLVDSSNTYVGDGEVWTVKGEIRTNSGAENITTGVTNNIGSESYPDNILYHVATVEKTGELQFTVDMIGLTLTQAVDGISVSYPAAYDGHTVRYTRSTDSLSTDVAGGFKFMAAVRQPTNLDWGMDFRSTGSYWRLNAGRSFSPVAENQTAPVFTFTEPDPSATAPVSITFGAATYSITEGQTSRIVITAVSTAAYPQTFVTLRRSGGTGTAADYEVAAQTIAGSEVTVYASAERLVIQIPAGGANETQNFGFDLQALTDTETEGDETLEWTIEPNAGYEVGTQSTTTVTITNARIFYYIWTTTGDWAVSGQLITTAADGVTIDETSTSVVAHTMTVVGPTETYTVDVLAEKSTTSGGTEKTMAQNTDFQYVVGATAFNETNSAINDAMRPVRLGGGDVHFQFFKNDTLAFWQLDIGESSQQHNIGVTDGFTNGGVVVSDQPISAPQRFTWSWSQAATDGTLYTVQGEFVTLAPSGTIDETGVISHTCTVYEGTTEKFVVDLTGKTISVDGGTATSVADADIRHDFQYQVDRNDPATSFIQDNTDRADQTLPVSIGVENQFRFRFSNNGGGFWGLSLYDSTQSTYSSVASTTFGSQGGDFAADGPTIGTSDLEPPTEAATTAAP